MEGASPVAPDGPGLQDQLLFWFGDMALLNYRDWTLSGSFAVYDHGKTRHTLSELLEDSTGSAVALSLNLFASAGTARGSANSGELQEL